MADKDEWECLFDGTNASVWMLGKCKKEMEEAPELDRAKVLACMSQMFCELEDVGQISNKKFNANEGRHKNGPLIQAFKSSQLRVYGATGSVNRKRAFFASHALIKKDEKLDPSARERATNRLDTVGTIPGSSLK